MAQGRNLEDTRLCKTNEVERLRHGNLRVDYEVLLICYTEYCK